MKPAGFRLCIALYGLRAVSMLLAVLSAAAYPLRAQRPIPVRIVSQVAVTDSGLLANVTSLRVLADGHVLVDDFVKRQIILLDSALRITSIVLDNSERSHEKYGPYIAYILPYVGDSTVFVDRASQAFVVIDAHGRVVRTMAAPRVSDLPTINSPGGNAAFDQHGRLFYRSQRSIALSEKTHTIPDSGVLVMQPPVDSAPILRADLDARTVDTFAMLHVAVKRTGVLGDRKGAFVVTLASPINDSDGWTLLTDGTVAVVRSRDYHIDWRKPDGTSVSTPKMPFDWRRISPEEKVRMIDSMKKRDADERARELAQAGRRPTEETAARAPFMTVSPDDIPDYYPPLRQGEVRADADGNVWILPSTSLLSTADNAGLVYDVVNRKGEIIQRVRLPEGRRLMGFGRGGIVYLLYQRMSSNHRATLLERAKIIQ